MIKFIGISAAFIIALKVLPLIGSADAIASAIGLK